jgi:hypothetical protein
MDSSTSFISVIKKGIKTGNVLVSVAEKGYANVFYAASARIWLGVTAVES